MLNMTELERFWTVRHTRDEHELLAANLSYLLQYQMLIVSTMVVFAFVEWFLHSTISTRPLT